MLDSWQLWIFNIENDKPEIFLKIIKIKAVSCNDRLSWLQGVGKLSTD